MKYFHSEYDLEFVLTENVDIAFKTHNHVSKYVVGLVLSGELKISVEDKESIVSTEDIFIIPIYSPHSMSMTMDDTKILSMCIGKEFINMYVHNQGQEILIRYIQELINQEVIKDKHGFAFEESMDIVVDLYQDQTKAVPYEIEKINQLLISEPERRLEIEKLAREIYISKYYLIRKFKEEIGLTPHNFQLQNRIRKAQNLLKTGENITTVGMELGFYDQSHFIKTFKSVVGITPSEYIDSIKKIE